MTPPAAPAHPFVGRHQEHALLDGLVGRVGAGGAVVVLGEPGAGRTSLLERVATAAPRTLWVRGVETEAALPFAAVADLLLPLREGFERLPAVQRDAVAVALTLRPGPDPRLLAVCTGTLGVLTAAGEGGLLVVVDDLQWMDRPSRQVLAFVARRLGPSGVVMLFAVREGPGRTAPSATDLPVDLPTVRLGGLTVGDCRELARGLGVDVPAAELVDIVDRTGGNPRAVVESLTAPADPAAVRSWSPTPRGAWVDAVAELPEATRVALFVVASLAEPGGIEPVLATLGCSLADLGPAESAGMVSTVPVLALRHPMLCPVVVGSTPLATRLAAYRALAAHAEPHLRAWYLAHAATGPDDGIADALAAAAPVACDRSGHHESARTWRRAALLTGDRDVRGERLLCAATDALLAGEAGPAVEWCDEALLVRRDVGFVADVELVRGRARTWLGRLPDAAAGLVLAGDAVSGRDAMRAARLYAEAAVPLAMANRVHDMLAVALRADAVTAQDRRASGAMTIVARTLRGDVARAREQLDPDEGWLPETAWDLQAATLLAHSRVWLEDFHGARRQLGAVLDCARRTGAAGVVAAALCARSELAAWTGNWDDAGVDAAEALRRAVELQQPAPLCRALVCLARLDAAHGDVRSCTERLDRARHQAGTHGIESIAVAVRGVLGFAALGSGEFEVAAEHLKAARAMAERGGLRGPNVVPYGADLVEACVHVDHVRAKQALAWLAERATGSDLAHPAAVVARYRGMLATDLGLATKCFAEAIAAHDRVEMPFERARTQLCEGETLRRLRRPAAARPVLREALDVFAGLGARPWVERAGRELAATGARHGTDDGNTALDRLTPQELQIARAVAEGASNAETASALLVSGKTVEAHLTRVYRKLGLRSRSELARSLARSS